MQLKDQAAIVTGGASGLGAATARKLAVLLHRLWVSGEAYEPLRNSRPVLLPAAA